MVMSPASSSSRDMMTASPSLTAEALVVATAGTDDVIVEAVGGLMGVGGMTTTLISPSSKISPEMKERVNMKTAIQREYIFNYKSLGHDAISLLFISMREKEHSQYFHWYCELLLSWHVTHIMIQPRTY